MPGEMHTVIEKLRTVLLTLKLLDEKTCKFKRELDAATIRGLFPRTDAGLERFLHYASAAEGTC